MYPRTSTLTQGLLLPNRGLELTQQHLQRLSKFVSVRAQATAGIDSDGARAARGVWMRGQTRQRSHSNYGGFYYINYTVPKGGGATGGTARRASLALSLDFRHAKIQREVFYYTHGTCGDVYA